MQQDNERRGLHFRSRDFYNSHAPLILVQNTMTEVMAGGPPANSKITVNSTQKEILASRNDQLPPRSPCLPCFHNPRPPDHQNAQVLHTPCWRPADLMSFCALSPLQSSHPTSPPTPPHPLSLKSSYTRLTCASGPPSASSVSPPSPTYIHCTLLALVTFDTSASSISFTAKLGKETIFPPLPRFLHGVAGVGGEGRYQGVEGFREGNGILWSPFWYSRHTRW